MPLTKDTFVGKVALVTGSNSGIGEGVAKSLAQAGCAISLHGRDQKKLDRVAAELRQIGLKDEQILATSADLNSDEEIKRLCQKTLTHFGRLDILVNNAGIGSQTGLEKFDEIHHIMLRAQIMMCIECEEALKRTKGCIINVSSIAAMVPGTKLAAYGIAKAGFDHFTRTYAQKLGPFGVRVNSVNPGVVKTPIFQTIRQTELPELPYEAMEQHVNERVRDYPLGRLGEKEDIGDAVAFLASDLASWITGICLPVEGGFLIGPKSSQVENATLAENSKSS